MKCEQCEFAFPSMIDLASHIEIAHPKTIPIKSKSSQEFTEDYIIEIEDYTCNECEYEGSQNSDLVKHNKSMHLKRNQSTTVNDESNSKEESCLEQNLNTNCSKCDQAFAEMQDLNEHVERIHKSMENSNFENITENEDITGKKTSQSQVFIEAIEFPCNICEFECNDLQTLRNHNASKHEEVISDQDIEKMGGKILSDKFCTECKFITDNEEDLNKHVNALHEAPTDVKDFGTTCVGCNNLLHV